MKDIQDIFPNHFDCIIFSSDIGRCFDLFIPWSCSSLEGRGNFLQSSKRNRGSKNFLLPQHCLSTTSPDYTRTKWFKLWSPRFLITFMLLQNSFSVFFKGLFSLWSCMGSSGIFFSLQICQPISDSRFWEKSRKSQTTYLNLFLCPHLRPRGKSFHTLYQPPTLSFKQRIKEDLLAFDLKRWEVWKMGHLDNSS